MGDDRLFATRSYLLLEESQTRRECQKLIHRFLRGVALVDTLHSSCEEIARMWRFTRSCRITEPFHNKMETISTQAYGFRNFENYRQRVQVLSAYWSSWDRGGPRFWRTALCNE
jgi:hypothetical protein